MEGSLTELARYRMERAKKVSVSKGETKLTTSMSIADLIKAMESSEKCPAHIILQYI